MKTEQAAHQKLPYLVINGGALYDDGTAGETIAPSCVGCHGAWCRGGRTSGFTAVSGTPRGVQALARHPKGVGASW